MGKSFVYRHLANMTTLFGLLLCFALLGIITLRKEQTFAVLVLSLVICLTDFLDGQFARRLKIVSKFGAALDRLRDKAWFAVLVLFFFLDEYTDFAVKLPILLLAVSEVALLALWFVGVIRNMDVSANWYGKVKQALMCTIIFACLALRWHSVQAYNSFLFCFLSALIFSLCFVLSLGSLKLHWTQYKLQLPKPANRQLGVQ